MADPGVYYQNQTSAYPSSPARVVGVQYGAGGASATATWRMVGYRTDTQAMISWSSTGTDFTGAQYTGPGAPPLRIRAEKQLT